MADQPPDLEDSYRRAREYLQRWKVLAKHMAREHGWTQRMLARCSCEDLVERDQQLHDQ